MKNQEMVDAARDGYEQRPNPYLYTSPCFYAHALGSYFKQSGRTMPFDVRMGRGYRIRANDMVFKIEGDTSDSTRFVREQ